MSALIRTFAILLLFGPWIPLEAQSRWTTKDGQVQTADAMDFDFESKVLILENPETGARSRTETTKLVRNDRIRLLFEPAFHSALNGRTPEISAARRYLLCIFAFTPAILLFAGFWIAGWLVGGSASPIRAFFGFLGGWACGVLFMFFYFMLSARNGGSSGILWFGAAISSIFVSVFVSAVYKCKTLKGFAIFFAHLAAAIFLTTILLFVCENFIPSESTNDFLDRNLFEPVGLISVEVSGDNL